MKKIYFCLFVLALGLNSVVQAQSTDALVADRPGFANSPISMQKSAIQIEGGGTWSQISGYNMLSGPEILARVGVFNKVEFRATLPNYIDVENSDASGLADITLGAKIQLMETGSDWQMAVIAQASIPTGDKYLTADRVEPEIILTASTSIGGSATLGLQGGLKSVEVVDQNKMQYNGTLVVSAPVSATISAFGELHLIKRPEFDADYVAHFGLALSVSDNLLLDIHGGSGLNERAVDMFMGVGASVRL